MSAAAPLVVVTAPAGALADEICAALIRTGLHAERRPLLTFGPPTDWAPVDEAVHNLSRYHAVAFTSPRAARAFTERASEVVPAFAPPIWASGAATAAAVGSSLGAVHLPESSGSDGAGAALARAMIVAGVGSPVLFPCGDRRRDELPDGLTAAGRRVDAVICYRTVLAELAAALAAARGADLLVVTSPSVVERLAAAVLPAERPRVVAIGPTTAAASRAAGWVPAAIADELTPAGVVDAVRRAIGHPSFPEAT